MARTRTRGHWKAFNSGEAQAARRPTSPGKLAIIRYFTRCRLAPATITLADSAAIAAQQSPDCRAVQKMPDGKAMAGILVTVA
jgi:hypothetical protein